ncbi:MAG TPA: TRAP transporter substrate-binding protein DctP [Pseudomonadales bacterium]|nr:TRAP transporter substrate-binding protein DctP [Pseudomonadales bacterium]
MSARPLRSAILLLAVLCCTAPQAFAGTFKIATLSPDGSSWMRLMRSGAEEIATRTDGRVKFKFYPGGVMGDDAAVLRKIRFGQLQGAAVTAGALTVFYPDMQLYNMPMVFRGYAEVDAVRAQLDGVLEAGLAEEGYEVFGFGEAGFAYAMSQVRATSVEDARRQKVWVPANDDGALKAIEGFGITPVPLSIADVLTGLQTDLIDAVAVPPVGALALQWHTQVDYLLDLPLIYVFGVLAVDGKAFARESEADRAVVHEVMRARFDEITRINRQDHDAALAALQNQGIEVLQPSDEDVAQWRARAESSRASMVEAEVVSDALYDRLEAILADFREVAP